MLDPVPSLESIDRVFPLHSMVPTTTPATQSAGRPLRQGMIGRQRPGGVGIAEIAAKPPQTAPVTNPRFAIERLKSAVSMYLSQPRTKAALPALVGAAEQASAAVDELLRVHYPLLPGETRATLERKYWDGGLTDDEDKRRHLCEWQLNVRSELGFLRGLFQFGSPLGQELARRAIFQRYQTTPSGVLMVGLHRSLVQEGLDPRHRPRMSFAHAFNAWLDQQIADGKDPAEGIVDFLLAFDKGDDFSSGGRAMSQNDLRSHELKLDMQTGLVSAYYVTMQGERVRYYPSRNDVYSAQHFLSVRRELYDSEAGGGQGAANRGGADFIKGDTYVVSGDGKLYSFIGNTIHSEFFSGAPVQCAGIIVCAKGKIQAIDNRSGHYRPGWKNLLQAVELLKPYFDKEAVVALVATETSTMFFTVDDYIRIAKRGFPIQETMQLVRGYQRQYNGAIPVPSSKMEYIPPKLRKGWTNGPDNSWDLFFTQFFVPGPNGKRGNIADWRPVEDWL